MIDRKLLIPQLDAYKEYLLKQPKKDKSGTRRFLSNTDEDYKRAVAAKAREILNSSEWKTDDIGNGNIGKVAIKAVQSNINLVGRFQVSSFEKDVEDQTQIAESALFDLFHDGKEKASFDKLCEVFGRKYDLISYLYFVYEPSRFLPLRPRIFDSIFNILKISLQTEGRCSWDNYNDYINTVDEIRNIMQEYYQEGEVDLLDAHSFLWDLRQRYKIKVNDVYNRFYGEGIIIKNFEEKVYVDFDGKLRIFPLPESFEKGYLICLPD